MNPIYLNHNLISSLELQRHNILLTPQTLYKYIKHTSVPDINLVTGTDIAGNTFTFNFVLPSYIHKPPEFNITDYPLNADESNFAHDKPFDYLTTWRVGSLDKYKSHKLYSGILDLLGSSNSMSRFSTIWKQLASAKMAVSWKFGQDNFYDRLLHMVFKPWNDEAPFYESKGRVTFVDQNCVSILPLLTYALCSLGTHLMTGMITMIEMLYIFNCYCIYAEKSYIDTKLSIKSKAREWLLEGIDKLGVMDCIQWDDDLNVIGLKRKVTTEPHIAQLRIIQNRLSRKTLPDLVQRYIAHILSNIKTGTDVMNYYMVTRIMTNDSAYLKTLTELSMTAAIQPRVEYALVTKPVVTQRLNDAYKYAIKQEYTIPDTPGYNVMNYLKHFVDAMTKKGDTINFNQAWLSFLTTSSPGKKLTPEQLLSIPAEYRKMIKARIGWEAIFAHLINDMETLDMAFSDEIHLVQRQQIDRRQRAIAGINNRRLYAGFPAYVLGKEIYDLNNNAAQGKQSGNALDLYHMLVWTGRRDMLFSSIDISGMDASIQTLTKDIYNTFILDIASTMKTNNYGPFNAGLKRIYDVRDNEERTIHMNAIWQVIAYENSNSQTSTTFKSKTFGTMLNYEGTYPSGRADTSTHHTVLLQGIIRGNQLRRRQENKLSSLAFMKDLGDDIMIMYNGLTDDVCEHSMDDERALNECGFKTTLDVSINSVVLLQQMVVNGSFWGYADRVSLWTREHDNEIRSMETKVAEMISITNDMSARVKDHDGLKMLQFFIGMYCLSSVTLEINTSHYQEMSTMLSSLLTVVNYDQNPKYNTRLLKFFLPIAWLYMYKGGEMPAFPMERRDGSFTCDESLFTPRGKYRRRLLFDLSDINALIDTSSLKLDQEWLDLYGFSSAEFLIDVGLLNLTFQAVKESMDGGTLTSLSQNLENYGDIKIMNKSRAAAARLRNAGIRMPVDIIFGDQIYSKIEQVSYSIDEGVSKTKKISDKLFAKLKSLLRGSKTKIPKTRYQVTVHSADLLHLYTFSDHEFLKLDYLPSAQYTSKTPISYSMHYQSDSWYLFNMLGGIDYYGNLLRMEVASIRGKFHNFKYDDPMFLKAYELYSSNRSLLPDFYVAINASPAQIQSLNSALLYYSNHRLYLYEYSVSPRQLFFVTDNPSDSYRLYEMTDNVTFSAQWTALTNIYTYIHMLSNVRELTGSKLILRCHNKMFDYLYAKRQKELAHETEAAEESNEH